MITYQFLGKAFVTGSTGFSPKPQYPKNPENMTSAQTIVIPATDIYKKSTFSEVILKQF